MQRRTWSILCQTDEQGELHPISYASRALQKHEKNTSFSPFLEQREDKDFPIKLTLLFEGLQNPPSKQLTNFEILKSKTRGVMN